MGSMEVRAIARDSAFARAIFATAAVTAALYALIGSGKLLGAALVLLSLSLTCAESCMALRWQRSDSWRVRRYWLIGASVCCTLALILGALAPLAG